MFKDPYYNESSDLDFDFIRKKLQKNLYFKLAGHQIVSILKKPKTNQYEVISNGYEATSYYYLKHSNNELLLHKENGPAEIIYANGAICYEGYFQNGIAHRADGPQEIQYTKGKVSLVIYRINNKQHKEDGPAHISYHYNTDKVFIEIFFINDKQHRENNPAYYKYDQFGNKLDEIWCKHGVTHRLDGPANTLYANNKILSESWVINGRFLDVNKYPIIKDNKVCGKIPLTKDSILDTILFDREYGTFLKEMYDKLLTAK